MTNPRRPSHPARPRRLLLVASALAMAAGCHHSTPPGAPSPHDADQANLGYGLTSTQSSAIRAESITAEQAGGVGSSRVEELLIARFPGVQVLPAAGGGFMVRIRGVNTLMGSGEPLYVVDRMPVQVTPGRGIDWLNPADISRIDVLKDAASTAVYGMRGANGVILITTRRPR